jgi:endonuclease YncB( thermonuclease family)
MIYPVAHASDSERIPMRVRLSDGSTIDIEVETTTTTTVRLIDADARFHYAGLFSAQRDEVDALMKAHAEQEAL